MHGQPFCETRLRRVRKDGSRNENVHRQRSRDLEKGGIMQGNEQNVQFCRIDPSSGMTRRTGIEY